VTHAAKTAIAMPVFSLSCDKGGVGRVLYDEAQ
jgi:hypothetical protein